MQGQVAIYRQLLKTLAYHYYPLSFVTLKLKNSRMEKMTLIKNCNDGRQIKLNCYFRGKSVGHNTFVVIYSKLTSNASGNVVNAATGGDHYPGVIGSRIEFFLGRWLAGH